MENNGKGFYLMIIAVDIANIVVSVISIIVTVVSIVQTAKKDEHQKSNRDSTK